ncbi:MAG: hypothetical protein JW757_12000 [Anaerolineales bacterium]|nr:hypothetical protein [Anaerolineales bacterium]
MPDIQIHTHTGKPIELGKFTIQPISQAVAWINRSWGFVWNRPYALKVEHDGHTRHIPIRDVTQIAFVVMWGLTVVFSLMTLWKAIKDWRTTHD